MGDRVLMNPHIDAVPLSHAGRTVVIRFTWRALKVLQRDWGKEWAPRMVEALQTDNAADLAELVAITTGMTAEEVEDWSPPLNAASKAVWDGYMILKTGQAEAPATAEGEAENPRRAQSILSKAHAVLRSVQVWAGPNSGKAPPTPPAST